MLTFVAPMSDSPGTASAFAEEEACTFSLFTAALPLAVPPAPLYPYRKNQNARGHQCFYSIFHADISLCVDSKVTIASVRMVDKKANHRNGKGRESGP